MTEQEIREIAFQGCDSLKFEELEDRLPRTGLGSLCALHSLETFIRSAPIGLPLCAVIDAIDELAYGIQQELKEQSK
jgi:hypothetical protein